MTTETLGDALPIAQSECGACGWRGEPVGEDRCPACTAKGSITDHTAKDCVFPALARPRLGEMPCSLHAYAYRTRDTMETP